MLGLQRALSRSRSPHSPQSLRLSGSARLVAGSIEKPTTSRDFPIKGHMLNGQKKPQSTSLSDYSGVSRNSLDSSVSYNEPAGAFHSTFVDHSTDHDINVGGTSECVPLDSSLTVEQDSENDEGTSFKRCFKILAPLCMLAAAAVAFVAFIKDVSENLSESDDIKPVCDSNVSLEFINPNPFDFSLFANLTQSCSLKTLFCQKDILQLNIQQTEKVSLCFFLIQQEERMFSTDITIHSSNNRSNEENLQINISQENFPHDYPFHTIDSLEQLFAFFVEFGHKSYLGSTQNIAC